MCHFIIISDNRTKFALLHGAEVAGRFSDIAPIVGANEAQAKRLPDIMAHDAYRAADAQLCKRIANTTMSRQSSSTTRSHTRYAPVPWRSFVVHPGHPHPAVRCRATVEDELPDELPENSHGTDA